MKFTMTIQANAYTLNIYDIIHAINEISGELRTHYKYSCESDYNIEQTRDRIFGDHKRLYPQTYIDTYPMTIECEPDEREEFIPYIYAAQISAAFASYMDAVYTINNYQTFAEKFAPNEVQSFLNDIESDTPTSQDWAYIWRIALFEALAHIPYEFF